MRAAACASCSPATCACAWRLSALALAATLLACAVWWPSELLLVGLVSASILPIALQLDWLALVDDRDGLAAALLLVRPVAFLALLGLCPLDRRAPAVAGLLSRRLGTGGPGLLDLRSTGARTSGRATVPVAARHAAPRRLAWRWSRSPTRPSSAPICSSVGLVLGTAAAGDYYLAGQILVAALLFANAAGQIALARLPALAHAPDAVRGRAPGRNKSASGVAAPAALAIAPGPDAAPAPVRRGACRRRRGSALAPALVPPAAPDHAAPGSPDRGRPRAGGARGQLRAARRPVPALALAGMRALAAGLRPGALAAELVRLAALLLALARRHLDLDDRVGLAVRLLDRSRDVEDREPRGVSPE